MPKLFFDMDGVVADFNGFILAEYGQPFTSLDNKEIWNDLVEKYPRLYQSLRPLEQGISLWNHLRPLKPTFLTAIPSRVRFVHAAEDKFAWGRQHLDGAPIVFGPYARDKQFHARPGDVLIDDNPMNIMQWNAAGGIGLIFNEQSHLEEMHEKVMHEMRRSK